MNRNRQEKGITLIALVITIIVLLILAGVSIATLAGEGGILNKATKAKNQNNQTTIEEEIKLAYHAVQTDSIIHGWDINKKAEELQKELREQGEEAKDAIVTVFQSDLLISYKGYEVIIHEDGTIEVEDPSLGDKPTGVVTILTTGANVEIVEIQVEASTTDGDIETIEAMNGAIEKENANNTNKKKIFAVSKNGIYYFRIKGTNGRTAILESNKIDNILVKSESLLQGISEIQESGIQTIAVEGKDKDGKVETIRYSLNVIYYKKEDLENGKLILDGQTTRNGSTLNNKVYEFGSTNDVGTNASGTAGYAKNTVVLKVDGDIEILPNVTLTSMKSASGYGGPKGMIVYCTGTITNNGTISMTARGAKAIGENVYLWKNKEDHSYEYVPAVGGNGGTSVGPWGAAESHAGVAGSGGVLRGTGGGGSGMIWKRMGSLEVTSGAGGKGTSYSRGHWWWRCWFF